ncbi:OTU domain-containing protein [Legionella dresdenensis]|uniref:OTU domain-containing protein n=1 Tax=Legionella dresdenensis TaxID=450200 RepID=A0ABV8CI94_9GAMM
MAELTGFFHNPVINNRVTAKPATEKDQAALVNMGGTGDCGFRAVAAAIIDNVFSNPHFNSKALARISVRHREYFPASQTGRLTTPAEWFKHQSREPALMAQFVRDLAYTLRQMAVDEFYARPDLYRGVFMEMAGEDSAAEMRKPNTWIKGSAIAALANMLELPINVHYTRPGHELHARLKFGVRNEKNKRELLTIHLENEHYYPKVKNIRRFEEAAANLPVKPAMPVVSPVNDPDLATVLKQIEEANRVVELSYAGNIHKLKALLSDKPIKKEKLLEIYVDNLKNSDYPEGHVNQVGLEHGNQNFFNAIHGKREMPTGKPAGQNHDERVISEVLRALARAITIDHLHAQTIFDQLEQAAEAQETAGVKISLR